MSMYYDDSDLDWVDDSKESNEGFWSDDWGDVPSDNDEYNIPNDYDEYTEND